MEAEVSIEAATLADIAALLQVQQASPGAAEWTPSEYEDFLAEPGHIFLVARGSSLVAFLAARVVADELEILNLAVEPFHRGRGIGALLLRLTLTEAGRCGARNAWLEVRDSNLRARAFYRNFGFKETYRRRRFYQHPVEDAVVCRRTLEKPA